MRSTTCPISKLLLGILACSVLLWTAACDRESSSKDTENQEDQSRTQHTGETIRFVYPEWSSEIASVHIFQAVLQERLGYRVETAAVPVAEMWQQVASGKADALTGAWLPTTHQDYYAKYREELEDLGPNLTGARIGLLVPTVKPGRQTEGSGRTGQQLVTIRSIPELKDMRERFGGRIVGIESGAGVMGRTREALEAYELKSHYRLKETNEDRMIERVSEAINAGEWIVFTGWRPHRIFELYNLRFLEDPKNVYGGDEAIHTMVRTGLEEDMPVAHAVLSRISYEPEEIERLMRWIHQNGRDEAYKQAVRWTKVHSDMVNKWVRASN